MNINIDKNSGFCWGVVQTIDKSEEALSAKPLGDVNILGEIIHNPQEIKRLADKGLRTVSLEEIKEIPKGQTLIIRAHGEPPETYNTIKELGLNLVDATCPLVQALQKKVQKYYQAGYQAVIFGKREHAEVIGLRGFCNDECIVIKSELEALNSINFNKKTVFISQTTMDKSLYHSIKDSILNKFAEIHGESKAKEMFLAQDTTCRYVYSREDNLRKFAKDNEVVIFVAGKNSSNGKSLFNICLSENEKTYFVEKAEEISPSWFDGIERVGVTGATSTPEWYLSEIKSHIINFTKLGL
jgi:4-hydroxy-3-methylbut-2-enyl diphosphate reductase